MGLVGGVGVEEEVGSTGLSGGANAATGAGVSVGDAGDGEARVMMGWAPAGVAVGWKGGSVGVWLPHPHPSPTGGGGCIGVSSAWR
jgi:hypothetical protein